MAEGIFGTEPGHYLKYGLMRFPDGGLDSNGTWTVGPGNLNYLIQGFRNYSTQSRGITSEEGIFELINGIEYLTKGKIIYKNGDIMEGIFQPFSSDESLYGHARFMDNHNHEMNYLKEGYRKFYEGGIVENGTFAQAAIESRMSRDQPGQTTVDFQLFLTEGRRIHLNGTVEKGKFLRNMENKNVLIQGEQIHANGSILQVNIPPEKFSLSHEEGHDTHTIHTTNKKHEILSIALRILGSAIVGFSGFLVFQRYRSVKRMRAAQNAVWLAEVEPRYHHFIARLNELFFRRGDGKNNKEESKIFLRITNMNDQAVLAICIPPSAGNSFKAFHGSINRKDLEALLDQFNTHNAFENQILESIQQVCENSSEYKEYEARSQEARRRETEQKETQLKEEYLAIIKKNHGVLDKLSKANFDPHIDGDSKEVKVCWDEGDRRIDKDVKERIEVYDEKEKSLSIEVRHCLGLSALASSDNLLNLKELEQKQRRLTDRADKLKAEKLNIIETIKKRKEELRVREENEKAVKLRKQEEADAANQLLMMEGMLKSQIVLLNQAIESVMKKKEQIRDMLPILQQTREKAEEVFTHFQNKVMKAERNARNRTYEELEASFKTSSHKFQDHYRQIEQSQVELDRLQREMQGFIGNIPSWSSKQSSSEITKWLQSSSRTLHTAKDLTQPESADTDYHRLINEEMIDKMARINQSLQAYLQMHASHQEGDGSTDDDVKYGLNSKKTSKAKENQKEDDKLKLKLALMARNVDEDRKEVELEDSTIQRDYTSSISSDQARCELEIASTQLICLVDDNYGDQLLTPGMRVYGKFYCLLRSSWAISFRGNMPEGWRKTGMILRNTLVHKMMLTLLNIANSGFFDAFYKNWCEILRLALEWDALSKKSDPSQESKARRHLLHLEIDTLMKQVNFKEYSAFPRPTSYYALYRDTCSVLDSTKNCIAACTVGGYDKYPAASALHACMKMATAVIGDIITDLSLRSTTSTSTSSQNLFKKYGFWDEKAKKVLKIDEDIKYVQQSVFESISDIIRHESQSNASQYRSEFSMDTLRTWIIQEKFGTFLDELDRIIKSKSQQSNINMNA